MDPSVPAAYGLSRLGLLALPALVSLHATALNTNLYAAYTLSAGFGLITPQGPRHSEPAAARVPYRRSLCSYVRAQPPVARSVMATSFNAAASEGLGYSATM